MSLNRKSKRTISRNNDALYKKAINLYLNKNKTDKALQILLKLAKIGYKKAFGEIGVIIYRENHDVDKAEEWFIKAEKAGALFGDATYEYGMLHHLEKNDWETSLSYLFKAAEQGYELAYGDIGTILYLYKSDINAAEEWFKKAEKIECLLAPAAYHYGQLLMIEKKQWEKSRKYFKQSAEKGFELAYADYASSLYLARIDIDEAEKWFKKAEENNCLTAPHAYNYGVLLIQERNEVERGNKYLDAAEADGY